MNERIKQLVKQAGLKSEIMLDDSSRDVECFVSEYDGSTPSIHYWEKFAQLIVAKVLDEVADRAFVSGDRAWSDDVDRHWVELEFGFGRLAKMKNERNFGVEE